MFSALQPVIYIQISPERLCVKNVKSGQAISEVPEVAISVPPKSKILGVGSSARSAMAGHQGQIINPFAHPRSLVSDFTVAEQLLKTFVRRVLRKSPFAFSPKIIIHPLGSPAGGFTQVERRAFREMAMGAGASEVIVWIGRDLGDLEILSGVLPAAGEWE
jgi:rod shape-determining protein MreB